MDQKIENLVFEGGGVLGMAYAGALKVLDDQNILGGVKRVAGTSAGSLVAMALSLGYDAEGIRKIIDDTNFKEFEDHWDPLRIATKYGLYKGDFLLNYIEQIVADKTGNKGLTFRQHAETGGRDLKVFACDLNTSWVKEFSMEKTPDVCIAHSVRASMSIPLFFQAWQFPESNPDNHIYVDGGTIYNYPLEAFEISEKTLGFYFQVPSEGHKTEFEFNHIIKYVEVLFKTIMNAQKINFEGNTEEVQRTVFIDTHGISPVNFKLGDDDKLTLFKSGHDATINYLKNYSSESA